MVDQKLLNILELMHERMQLTDKIIEIHQKEIEDLYETLKNIIQSISKITEEKQNG